MAVEYYCDRCGALIPRTDKFFLRHAERYHAISLFHDEFAVKDPVEWIICKNCGDKYITWFNHPERDNE